MASIGDLVANLTVNSAGWSRGLKTAKSETGGFVSSVGSLLSSPVGKLAALAAGAVSVGAAFYGVTQSIGRTAGVADQAARTGLSGEFLQRLGYAADQAGVDSETLTKSLSKMTLVVGEATSGNKAAQSAFSKLGLSVSDLADLSPEEQFASISDALGGIPDTAKRAAAAVDIFGKSGAELGPLFEQGSGGIAAAMGQAATLGIGLSDDDIQAAAAADDAMSRLSATVTAVIDKVSAKLAPAWTMAADAVTSVMPALSSLLDAYGEALGFVADYAAVAWDYFSKGVVTALAVAEFAFKNWQGIGEYAVNSVLLGIVKMIGVTSHFFTQGLPGYLSWFGDNWRDVFYTAFDFVSTGILNLADNVSNAWNAIIAYITGDSDSLALVWKPLTDGFVSTVKELPDIPERAISDLEQQLGKETANLGKNLGNSLTGTIEKNLAMLPKIQSALKMEAPTAAAVEPVDTGGAAGAQESKTLAGAMNRGSAEAYSAIVHAMSRGQQNKIQQDQLTELKRLNANIKGTGIAKAERPLMVEAIT
jgi:hypothetical protein